MDEDPGVIPDYARIKDSVRIIAAKDRACSIKFLVEDVLGGVFNIQKQEILGMLDFPRRRIYDVTFTSSGILRDFMAAIPKKNNPKLVGLRFVEHVLDDTKLIVLKVYSAHVPLSSAENFLKQHVKSFKYLNKITNEAGIWACKWRFLATFHKDPACPGKPKLPPARFKLDKVNAEFFCAGMPDFCRRCQEYGHTKENCGSTCSNCGSKEHEKSECPGKKCYHCQDIGHLFASCPRRQQERQQQPRRPAEEAGPSRGEELDEMDTSNRPPLDEMVKPQEQRRNKRRATGRSIQDPPQEAERGGLAEETVSEAQTDPSPGAPETVGQGSAVTVKRRKGLSRRSFSEAVKEGPMEVPADAGKPVDVPPEGELMEVPVVAGKPVGVAPRVEPMELPVATGKPVDALPGVPSHGPHPSPCQGEVSGVTASEVPETPSGALSKVHAPVMGMESVINIGAPNKRVLPVGSVWDTSRIPAPGAERGGHLSDGSSSPESLVTVESGKEGYESSSSVSESIGDF